MQDISLHIMDIAENSLRAGAKNVSIRLVEDRNRNTLVLEIEDDGKGMDEGFLENATNPFFTTKPDKEFGLGLSLLAQASELTGGKTRIERRSDRGIKISALFDMSSIDMKPMGDIDKTMRVLEAMHPEVNFSFEHLVRNGEAV